MTRVVDELNLTELLFENVSEAMVDYRLPLDGSVAGLTIANKRSYLIENSASARGHTPIEQNLIREVGARSFIIVPLMAGEEPIGTITVANKQTGRLGPEDERVLTMLASGAVIALQNARLFTNLEQRKQALEALYRADEELYRYLSLDSVLNSLVNVAVEILQADKSSVMVWNAARTRLQIRAHHGFRPETVEEMSFAPGEGIIGRVAQRGQLITVEDSEREEAVARRITEADVLPRLWKKDETEGRQRLGELRELNRGALAEMRMLLLELRPTTLTEVGLGALLRQLVDGAVGRSRLPIALQIEGQPDLPPEVQVALYRIAQEALNNVIKHSEAETVSVSLFSDKDAVALRIEDNGRGFDPRTIPLHTLGLSIMQERAEQIDASLTINSTAGAGTVVAARWPTDTKEMKSER